MLQINKFVFARIEGRLHFCIMKSSFNQYHNPMYKNTLKWSRIFKAVLWLFAALPAASLFAQPVNISGNVRTLAGNGLGDVNMTITNTDHSIMWFAMTQSDGSYQFSVPAGDTYTIKPYKDDDPLNGVSTFDLVILRKQITGDISLLSPYQLIALDVDGSNAIDYSDTAALRQLILGISTQLPNIGSWRFVKADYVFPDPQNPFPFPEVAVIESIAGDVSGVDFIAIKAGDINGSATGDSIWKTKIIGQVRIDENADCQTNINEPPLENWIVSAQGTGGTYYATTTGTGHYAMNVYPGMYDVRIIKPNNLWEVCADTVPGVQVNLYDTVSVDFPVHILAECPVLEVDLSTPYLRRCFDNTYNVFYCNKGTSVAENAYVEVEFDSLLAVVGSTLPWSSVNGNTYTFDLGDVAAGNCDGFYVTTHLSCDAVLGQTHCSEAHIFPDSLCADPDPLWSGANLELTGTCQNGEVVFTITNTGEPMTEPIEYIVIEDIMIQMTGGSVLLDSGESQIISLPANGSTWRLEMPQATKSPWYGLLSATVEACGENASGNYSLGFATLFPTDNPAAFIDADCQENIGSFDPNDKQGFPRGVAEEHFIPKDAEIEYLIRFQNTGTDTAFTVRILDTLSQWLDVSTLRQTGGSHPCKFNVMGPGVVQFLFQDIMLPDSNVNEPASHGFARFAIRPKPGVPNLTAIENEAAIYFDFNDPVITNRTLHTLGEKYLSVSAVAFRPGIELAVYPNPTFATATVRIKSISPVHGDMRLFDIQGRQIKVQPFHTNTFDLDATGMPPGVYFFRLDSNGEIIGSGKLIVHRRE